MALGIRRNLEKLADFTKAIRSPNSIPIWRYHSTPNVGDSLNDTLLPAISSRPVFIAKSEAIPHLRAIGSILDYATPRSITWGSGLIQPSAPKHDLAPHNIKAVRGHLTRQIVEEAIGAKSLALGDPAVLTGKYIKVNAEKKYDLGIVPHYVDAEQILRIKEAFPPWVHVLNVHLSPVEFITSLNRCKYILSSSLHGLILSDAYCIPNAWVRFAGELKGGDFKFLDYYSTTNTPNKKCQQIHDPENIAKDFSAIKGLMSVSEYSESEVALISSFPKDYDWSVLADR